MSRALTVALAGLGTCGGVVLPRPAPAHPLIAAANPAARYVGEPTPAAKLLEVSASAIGETIVLLCFIRLCAVAVGACHSPRSRAVVTAISWFLVIQGSQRLQGVMQSSKEVLNPGWYDSLKKPIWQPAPWVFPLVWIPLKMMQTVAASRLWAKLDYKSFSEPSIVLFIVHIALGDIWNRQFFLKQRLLTGYATIMMHAYSLHQRLPQLAAKLRPRSLPPPKASRHLRLLGCRHMHNCPLLSLKHFVCLTSSSHSGLGRNRSGSELGCLVAEHSRKLAT
eukprot:CAMPEP_0205867450 /NCGR_PEP_ID=MMETSP1083-20121108/8965_1 /ASSEMBLY_ACC=CAM_ASM_000430 /TAXON_ID=97485 /ORGANISM="Prymnesium parvum, Strain Texoma1" /LENGTH=278 /DNA_ID=CAMNT_0053229533 /DNA_START=35 /DNA_END=871 /DNA_ORIENTATION=+